MSEQEIDENPWQQIAQRYTSGQVVSASITRSVPFGAFARLEEGIEGFIPRSELPAWMNPLQDLHEGQKLPLRIIEMEPEKHRIKLSLLKADT